MTKDEFGLRLSKDCAVTPGAHVLAAVSGGADSMALLCFFQVIRDSYPLRLSCAHVEHGIRGAASKADMAFLQAFCVKAGIPFYGCCVDAPAYAAQKGMGLEEASRILRYDFLHRTAAQIGADVIALAHHAGDQAETVLLHAVRGCDIGGLCAMRYRSGKLIRPLLGETAQSLRDALAGFGCTWREDETNEDVRYARNRIRHAVMPQLERISPRTSAALCRLAQAARRDEEYFLGQIDALDLHIRMLIDGAAIEKKQILALHPALLSRIVVRLIEAAGVKPQGARVIADIMDVLERSDAAVNLTDGAHALIGKGYLCVLRNAVPEMDIPLALSGETHTPAGTFFVREAASGEYGDGVSAQRIPLHELEGLRITCRREGDTMVPFGMHAPVKLKKLMIDAGTERALRASVPVLRSARGIVWAAGLRPGEACRTNDQDIPMIVEYSVRQCRLITEE